MKKRYFSDEEFQIDVRKILSLPFIPASDIVKRFDELQDFLQTSKSDAVPLLKRIEDFYLKGEIKENGERSKPRFPPDMWCMVDNLAENLPCTTNFLEGKSAAWISFRNGTKLDKQNFID